MDIEVAKSRVYLDTNPSLLEDAELAYQNLSHQEVQLIKEAQDLFTKQVIYVKKIDQLREFVPNIGRIDNEIRGLSTLVDSSSTLAEEVCSKFKRIDSAKVRLDDCLSKIGDILDLRTCRVGVMKAMEANNYEEAAMHIKRYLSIDQEQFRKTINIICDNQPVPTLLDPQSMYSSLNDLDQARRTLLTLCKEGMQLAINENNTKAIDRFFKIFPLLNEHQYGLERYSEYLKGKVHLNETLVSKKASQADKLAALYELLAKLIDAHQPLIETYYGPGHLMIVFKVLQAECDLLCRAIFKEFIEETNLQGVVNIVRSSPVGVFNPNPPKINPKSVDKILNELTSIISKSEVYLSFVVQRIQDDIRTELEAQKKKSQLEIYNFIFQECELNYRIQEIGGTYVMLEQFYLSESSKKALLMDQVSSDSSSPYPVSSMLDDIFFLIKKCTERAVTTKSIEIFCAVINHCVTLLEFTFCQVLEERLKGQEFGTMHYSALNNLERACDYIKTLRSILDVSTKKLKPSILATDNIQDKKSETCLNEMSQLIHKFNSIMNSSLYQLFNTSLKSNMRLKLKTILEDNPDLASTVANDPSGLMSLARTMLESSEFERKLLPENFSKLVSITKDFIASLMK